MDDAVLASTPVSTAVRPGNVCFASVAQGTMCNILDAEEVMAHKLHYYLERRDLEFEAKMAEALCVYRKGKLLKEDKRPCMQLRSCPTMRSRACRRSAR
jgi:hypothetical protein